MQFNVLTKTHTHIVYDNEEHKFTVSGAPVTFIDLKSTPKHRVRIVLGHDCNQECLFCSNKAYTVRAIDNNTLFDIIDKKIHGEVSSFEFWGGEPLLYWDKIKELVPLIKRRYNPDFFYLSTNGVLLTEDKVKYCIANKISISVSYDGEGQFLRGVNPFYIADFRQAIKLFCERDIKNVCFTPVMSKYNWSFKEYRDNIKKYFNTPFRIGTPAMLKAYGENTVKYGITDFTLFLQQNYEDLITGKVPEMTNTFNNKIVEILKGLNYKSKYACMIESPYYTAIQVDGKFLKCHNFDLEENDKKLHVLFKSYYDTHCKNCLLKQLCKGGCPFTLSENRKVNEYNCKANFAWYSLQFSIFCGYLISGPVVEVSPV